jgi:hypothetical protein
MAVLVFLLAAFLLVLPFRYVGEGEVYSATLLGLAFVGIALILPGMVLGAAPPSAPWVVWRATSFSPSSGTCP